jgi:crotonobetainyl-CoA:carnitine CoA-transferase CaiB-like acyl-CoA transferase
MKLPFEGITVISIEQAIAAPLATRHLADWGARVIKIERTGEGDFARKYDKAMHGVSSQFAWANRSKESLELDIKSEFGQEVLEELLQQAECRIVGQALSQTGCMRHIRLRFERPIQQEEGLRPAGAVRDWFSVD